MEKSLRELIEFEKNNYRKHVILSNGIFVAKIKNEPQYRIMKWQIYSRRTDYYRKKMKGHKSFLHVFYGLLYLYYIRKRQILGEKLGLEISTEKIGKGLIVYHYNNVVNACAVIGDNCHLHGTNVIGNNGKTNENPIIGNNVTLGAGAKIIGPVRIADNIKIAAGAVVVSSFNEPGITLAGIPAKKIK